MKNLFRIDRTGSELNSRLEPTPFDRARITPELAREIDDVTAGVFGGDEHEQDKEIREASRPDARFWIGVGLMLVVLAGVLFGGDRLFSKDNLWISWVGLGLLAVSLVLITMSRRAQRKAIGETVQKQSDFDFKAGMEKLEVLSAEARKQLEIPDDAEELDVFPFVFTVKDGAEKSCYRKGRFDNLPLLAWRRGQALCLSDSHVVLEIPSDAILGKQTYDEDFALDMWLKETKCTEGRFKPYNLKKSGLMGCKGHTFYGIVVRSDTGDSYEMLVPVYDLSRLEVLVDLPDLGGTETV